MQDWLLHQPPERWTTLAWKYPQEIQSTLSTLLIAWWTWVIPHGKYVLHSRKRKCDSLSWCFLQVWGHCIWLRGHITFNPLNSISYCEFSLHFWFARGGAGGEGFFFFHVVFCFSWVFSGDMVRGVRACDGGEHTTGSSLYAQCWAFIH